MSFTKNPFKLMPEPPAMVAGVCSGLAYSLGMPTWLMRCLFVLALFMTQFAPFLIIYIVLWIIADSWDKVPENYEEVSG